MLEGTIGNGHEQAGARTSAGFSLLEVMIALSVLGVGIIGMLALQVTAMKLSGDSRVKTEAAFLAQQQVEIFHTMTPTEVTDRGSRPQLGCYPIWSPVY